MVWKIRHFFYIVAYGSYQPYISSIFNCTTIVAGNFDDPFPFPFPFPFPPFTVAHTGTVSRYDNRRGATSGKAGYPGNDFAHHKNSTCGLSCTYKKFNVVFSALSLAARH